MDFIRRTFLFAVVATAAVLAHSAAGASAAAGALAAPRASFADAARTKPDVTIVVTDSGLGGLSVAADLAARLPASGIVRSAHIVFVNAEPDPKWGYNDLRNDADKVRIFDSALAAMETRYEPDIVLIACNTLSVVWPRTEHARAGGVETVEIVSMGAGQIRKALAAEPDATALVFATKTTIESGAHRRLLVEAGVPSDRVVGEACPRLAGAIERGSASAETTSYVTRFVADALEKRPVKKGPVIASLNCTHFPYVRPLWEQAFSAAGHPGVKVLDPNPLMTDLVLNEGGAKRYPRTSVTVEAVSKVPVDEGTRKNLGALLARVSPETADALARIRVAPDLFPATVEAGGVIPR
jgi:glutamate racemase